VILHPVYIFLERGTGERPGEIFFDFSSPVRISGAFVKVMERDQLLIRRFVERNDREALEELFGRHYPSVYHVVLRLVHDEFKARDVTQSAFLNALKALKRYRPTGNFRNWLLKIAVNEVRGSARRERAKPPTEPLFEAYLEAKEESAERSAMRVEFEQALDRALSELPETLKAPIVLHYYQELSFAEIGEILDMPKDTAKSRAGQALRKLKSVFRKKGLTALVPLFKEYFPTVSATARAGVFAVLAGVLIMNSKIVVAVTAAGVLLIAGIVGSQTLLSPESDSDKVSVPASAKAKGKAKKGRKGKKGKGAPAPPAKSVEAGRTAPGEGDPASPPESEIRVTGKVTDAETGAPVADARIAYGNGNHEEFMVEKTKTNAGGRYHFSLSPGDFNWGQIYVYAIHPEYGFWENFAAADTRDGAVVDVALKRGGKVWGRVCDKETDLPLPGALIRIQKGGPGGTVLDGRFQETTTEGGGKFTIGGIDRNQTFEIAVTMKGYLPVSENFHIPATKSGFSIEFRLEGSDFIY
jgi:RNA polymerase sigma-70 factor (ECF subfamily)